MKKVLAFMLAAMMMASVAVGCGNDPAPSQAESQPQSAGSETPSEAPEEPQGEVTVGTCIYKFDDTFMTGVRNNMTAQAETLGAKIDIVDSQNKQPTQNEQVDTFITKGVNALAVNPVDLTAAGPIITKAKDAGLPIVLLNRQPSEDDMNLYDQAWYVGCRAEQSGTMSGQIIADYFTAHPEADKNGDGKVQYVMLQGEPGHQDATLRSEYAPKAIEEAGFGVEQLAADTAMWDKVKATDLMKAFLSSQGVDKIEAVLCNNDDMALGAIEALKAEGYNTGDAAKYIPVVGVDATAPALEAMKDGSLLGTVLNDAENQGKATVNIAVAAAQGKEINKENTGYEITDGKYVWIDYVKVTADNYQDYMS
ncbi:galactose ABC transporter substrate-binding protein [Clostridium sp. D33t1_170424_F3]|uniref:galactose ABC transporter substrate-binding protein n=1 Tax=Clostridium sp. D33t1_170424_F3 TaxID=2787099 RepID=UPI0018ABCAB3|nr:galactose ABC transporter substrate-binding protein [Clostridium sp. D33t1_170424_F3]